MAHVAHSVLLFALHVVSERRDFESAIKSPHWVVAMDVKLKSLASNRTWALVPRPKNTNIVGSNGCLAQNVLIMAWLIVIKTA